MNWLKYKWLYFLISALMLVLGIFSLLRFGFKPAIDFTGGTLLEYRFSNEVSSEMIRLSLEAEGYQLDSLQASGEKQYLLRLPPMDKEKAAAVKISLSQALNEMPEEIRFEIVGPTLGKELLTKTLAAVVLAAGFILAYVAWRFKNFKFGACAILAMFHDTLILLGTFSLLGHFFGVEIDTLFVTAVLTILSFSVHDTVVVYDGIRNSQRLSPQTPFTTIVNQAISETIVRSLNNSLTIIFMLVALVLLGGETIRWFVVALLVGTIAGTYSSTFTAAPLLAVWTEIEAKRKK